MNQCLMFLEILQHSIQILIWISHSFPQNSLLRSAHRLVNFVYHCSSITYFTHVPLALSWGQPRLLLCLWSSLSRDQQLQVFRLWFPWRRGAGLLCTVAGLSLHSELQHSGIWKTWATASHIDSLSSGEMQVEANWAVAPQLMGSQPVNPWGEYCSNLLLEKTNLLENSKNTF